MLIVLKKNKKKVLITIDEASNTSYMRSFAHDFQSLLRSDYPVYALMTGLYENVNSLQNNKNLTFLYRAPKINLNPLNKDLIKEEYELRQGGHTRKELFEMKKQIANLKADIADYVMYF